MRTGRKTRLLGWGFQEADAAAALFDGLGADFEEVVGPYLAHAADPDAALSALAALAEDAEWGTLRARLLADEAAAMRVVAVLGASRALADHLIRHPRHWVELDDPARGDDVDVREELAALVAADTSEPMDALRIGYRRLLLRIAARDLADDARVPEVCRALSDLAGAALEVALQIARRELPEAAANVRLAVIAMGKCGAGELNYISDVDVLFAHEAAPGVGDDAAARAATQLASRMMAICVTPTAEGSLWEVDAALRPEGKAGPLSRTVASHLAYYQRWAKTWEFQALLKARFVAGDAEVGAAYHEAMGPLVWQAAGRDDFVDDVQAMRRRVLDHLPAAEAGRQLKLGAGGLRDVEFAVQLLQLVHGRTDESVRVQATWDALAALSEGGYIGREDAADLTTAYEFLRRLEHRLQLARLRRTHVVPEDPEALRTLARAMGWRRDPQETLEREWAEQRREVRRLHEKLFYRPLLSAVARMSSDEARLSPEAAEGRLLALGYADPKAALRHLEALTGGHSRTAAIQRALLPPMLGWFADASDPDAGLFGFRRISDALGRTPWYLKTLRDEGEVAERLAKVLASSRFATDLLEREPEGVRLLGEDLTPLSSEAVLVEMQSVAARQADAEGAVRAIRGIRRRELLRIAAGDVLGLTSVEAVGEGLGRLTDATLEATLVAVVGPEPQVRMSIIAMGRYGGLELSYASDADVMFVYEACEGVAPEAAAKAAHDCANEVRRLLAAPGSDPLVEVDADLRPEGRQGPLVRTLASYAAYYAKWSATWEAQALLRADPVVGDRALNEAFRALIDPLRFPAGGLSAAEVAEIRRIKARVDAERLPRGADPHTHFKLGRGGLADVEWTVQLLQLQHGAEHEALRTPQTLAALRAAADVGVVAADDAATLQEAWLLVSRVRNALTLITGRPAEQLPTFPRDRAALALLLGYPPGSAEVMVNDFLRITRRARAVVDRVFWEN